MTQNSYNFFLVLRQLNLMVFLHFIDEELSAVDASYINLSSSRQRIVSLIRISLELIKFLLPQSVSRSKAGSAQLDRCSVWFCRRPDLDAAARLLDHHPAYQITIVSSGPLVVSHRFVSQTNLDQWILVSANFMTIPPKTPLLTFFHDGCNPLSIANIFGCHHGVLHHWSNVKFSSPLSRDAVHCLL